jgi:hypothetical protein
MELIAYKLDAEACPLVPGRTERPWMDAFDSRHPYRCLPLVIANSSGWEILSPCTFTITWNGGPANEDFRFDAEDGYASLNRIVTAHLTHGTVTFHTGYLFRTPPGWNVWAGGPPNWPKDGISPLQGIVETDWLPFPFTMNWHMTRPGMVRFEKGEPFCFVFPIQQTAVDETVPIIRSIDVDPQLRKDLNDWSESRSSFLDRLEKRDPDTVKQGWQRHYFTGKTSQGEQAQALHIHRRRLKPPIDETR